jgi:4'-phosphopantetheinyl transferase
VADAPVEVWVRDSARPRARAARSRNVRPDVDAPDGLDGLDRLDGLDAEERRRWHRLTHPRDAAAYLELHLLARSEIGRALGLSPQEVRFDRTCLDCGLQHGAPRVLDDPGLHVSLSRSGSVVAVALSRGGPVGVDVEAVAGTSFDGFEAVALHPGERSAARDPAADATAWVRKEASLKALGVGLRVDATTFATPVPGVPARVVAGRPMVTVADIAAPSGYAAAVARTSPGRLDVVVH